MENSILSFQEYTAAGNWRRPEQLRGLLRNHPDLVAASGPLAAPGNIFASARAALHDTENALAIALSPFIGAGSVGIMSLDETGKSEEPTLAAAARMRWLDLSGELKTSCVEWCDDLLLVGSSRGRIVVADVTVDACKASSSLLEPCGALTTGPAEPPLSDVTVSPSGYAAVTLVRSVKINTDVNRSSVVATRGQDAHIWDLNGGPMPVRTWSPHSDLDSTSVLMFARWAPGSDAVVLTGNYDGTLMLTDTRCAGAGNGLAFGLREGYIASCADFNAVMPFVFAAASSDGTFSVFDVRYSTQAVLTIPSLQGDITSMQWLRLQSDMIVTGGTDGSVSLWNLRRPPTYCVGRAQFQFPLTDLVTTETFLEQRAIGVSIGGELTMTGLKREPMMALAPSLDTLDVGSSPFSTAGAARKDSSASTPPLSPTSTTVGRQPRREDTNTSFASTSAEAARAGLEERERRACGCLYTRRLQEGYALLCECASERFAMKATERAMKLVSLIDVNRTATLNYDAFLQSKRAGLVGADTGTAAAAAPTTPGEVETVTLSLEEARQAFDAQLLHTTSRLCTSVRLSRIRTLTKPDGQDLRKLEALRLNTLLHRVLATEDPETVATGVRQALDLLSAHPESFELIDADVVSGIVALLLRKNYAEGERFVRALLSFLEQATSGGPATVALFRRILTTVQEPLITGGLPSRAARRYEDRFFSSMSAAKDAVLTQLEIQRLGVENHHEVVSIVYAYLDRCRRQKAPDMFNWLGMKPMILFLHCLTADSNYVSFFWTCVQCIEAWASFPLVRQIESVLFEVVGRIHTAAVKIVEDLDDFADQDRFSVPLLRQADNTLRTAHSFLTVLLRVQFESERLALRSSMAELPPVMAKIQDVLNTASEDVLDAWAGVIDALMNCGQPDVVRKFCFNTVRDFSFAMEDLMDVSAKGENDERLNEILDVCDDFLDAIGKRR